MRLCRYGGVIDKYYRVLEPDELKHACCWKKQYLILHILVIPLNATKNSISNKPCGGGQKKKSGSLLVKNGSY